MAIGTIGHLAIDLGDLKDRLNKERKFTAELRKELTQLRAHAATTPQGRRLLVELERTRRNVMQPR